MRRVAKIATMVKKKRMMVIVDFDDGSIEDISGKIRNDSEGDDDGEIDQIIAKTASSGPLVKATKVSKMDGDDERTEDRRSEIIQ